jgi:hypothetical protein
MAKRRGRSDLRGRGVCDMTQPGVAAGESETKKAGGVLAPTGLRKIQTDEERSVIGWGVCYRC